MSFLNSKKFKELQIEKDELKKLVDGLSEKETRLKNFDDLVKKARLDYAEISAKKDQTAQKLESLEKDKVKLINDLNKISSEIRQLREMKLAEQNQILSIGKAINSPDQSNENEISAKSKQIIRNEIEAAEKRKNVVTLETSKLKKRFEVLNNKISDSEKVLERLNSDIEIKKADISSLIERQTLLSDDQYRNFNSGSENKNVEEIQRRIDKLDKHEKELINVVNNRKQLLIELEKRIGEKRLILNNESSGEIHKLKISDPVQLKNENNLELEIKIEAHEARLLVLIEDIRAKTELHREVDLENKRIFKELELRTEELSKLKVSIETETIRLTDLDYSLDILEEEFDKLSKEISGKISIREKIDLQIADKTNQKVNLEDLMKELRETTTIIARLKNDIETGSGQSAKRFTGILQYYSAMINDLYKKKTELEKMSIKIEKELDEKENQIEERQAMIDEIENILYVKYQRRETIKDLSKSISEQRKQLRKSGFTVENTETKKNNVVNDAINQQKLFEYEKALKELIEDSDKFSPDMISSNTTLEKEITGNKNRVNELNQNIRHSTNELTELKNSIYKIKIEHEEHRLSINKLSSIKSKLEEQIEKYRQVIDKYSQIKDKIKLEQEALKMKREKVVSNNSPDNINSEKKSIESHNPNWIKL